MIIRKLKERDGVTIHTVKEAMETMIQDGIRELIVQPTISSTVSKTTG